MTADTQPIKITYDMTDADLYEMVMHSKSPLFGWSGRAHLKALMALIAVAFMMMAFGMPTVVGMPADDPGKVPFQVGLVVAGGFLAVFYPGYARWYTRRASKAYQTLPLTIALTIDDAGINAQLDGQSGTTAWKLIERVAESEKYIFLYLNRLRGYIIPKAALSDETELERLRLLIASHVVAKA